MHFTLNFNGSVYTESNFGCVLVIYVYIMAYLVWNSVFWYKSQLNFCYLFNALPTKLFLYTAFLILCPWDLKQLYMTCKENVVSFINKHAVQLFFLSIQIRRGYSYSFAYYYLKYVFFSRWGVLSCLVHKHMDKNTSICTYSYLFTITSSIGYKYDVAEVVPVTLSVN